MSRAAEATVKASEAALEAAEVALELYPHKGPFQCGRPDEERGRRRYCHPYRRGDECQGGGGDAWPTWTR